MIELTVHNLSIVGPLLQKRIEESRLGDRITMDRALSWTHSLIENNRGAAFVDDEILPTACVIVQYVPRENSVVFDESYCSVILIYVPRESRTLPKALACVRAIEDYAKSKNCHCIYGSSWKFQGVDGDGIGKLWEHAGYEVQEIVYRKKLT